MSATLRDGSTTEDPRLDRLVSQSWEHVDKYPLTAATMPQTDQSMVIGVNWYAALSRPTLRRIRGRDRFVLGDGGDLGGLLGGHAVCLRNWNVADVRGWWEYYDQGVEGRCVEFACLRERSLSNRTRYDITSRVHYWMMQESDYWPGGSYPGAVPHYEGTSVDAGQKVMKGFGPVRQRRGGAGLTPEEARTRVLEEDRTEVYRWARSWDDVRQVLGVPGWLPGVPLLNSWGRGYPREVILLDEVGERLLREDGEFAVVTDR